ncbi:type II secretion system protein N [Phenylobacterium sp. J426]|uniref:type II secretion system protein N n=1 Tax=Phenylobacterium sp. J426 TaxID=2898439 RepID=UPI0035B0A434
MAGEVEGRGLVKLRRRGLGLSAVDARLPLARVAPGLPFDGTLSLDHLRVDLDNGCRSAAGRVALEDVRMLAVDQPIRGLRLTGNAACEGGRLVLPMKGGRRWRHGRDRAAHRRRRRLRGGDPRAGNGARRVRGVVRRRLRTRSGRLHPHGPRAPGCGPLALPWPCWRQLQRPPRGWSRSRLCRASTRAPAP